MNIDQQEVTKFAELAEKWWDKNGDFKPLHVINPLRAKYIEDKITCNGKEILDVGGKASGSLLNVIEENSIEDLVNNIESDIGPIDTVIYNIGAQIGDRALAETSYKAFEMGWRMATFGLFRLAQVLTPKMKERQAGNIIVTSATSAVRGNKGQHSHAAAMGGRRMLCQSLNAEFAKEGIHVAHVIIDGAVDAPDTLGKMLGSDLFEKFKKHVNTSENTRFRIVFGPLKALSLIHI